LRSETSARCGRRSPVDDPGQVAQEGVVREERTLLRRQHVEPVVQPATLHRRGFQISEVEVVHDAVVVDERRLEALAAVLANAFVDEQGAGLA
jgi:hypothetical protein